MRTRIAQVAPCLASVAVVVAGCGGNGNGYKDTQRPPLPIVVTASINDQTIAVSRTHFGAGPITLIVTNQTSASQQITLEVASGAAGFKGQTGPINPRDTGQLQADLAPGTYSVHVADASIRAAHLTVGRRRASAQNDLLQP